MSYLTESSTGIFRGWCHAKNDAVTAFFAITVYDCDRFFTSIKGMLRYMSSYIELSQYGV